MTDRASEKRAEKNERPASDPQFKRPPSFSTDGVVPEAGVEAKRGIPRSEVAEELPDGNSDCARDSEERLDGDDLLTPLHFA